jgi:hypothetical protein
MVDFSGDSRGVNEFLLFARALAARHTGKSLLIIKLYYHQTGKSQVFFEIKIDNPPHDPYNF